METINELIEQTQEDLEAAREIYPWYAAQVSDLEARLTILEEVKQAMISNGEQ